MTKTQEIHKKIYVFDFDETIVTTKARIHVYRNGVHIKSLTSKEYNFYVRDPKDKLDFSEFVDGEMILNAKKHKKIWPLLRNVSNAIREKRSTSEIYILTARSKAVKSYIYEFLKRNGIEISLNNIITIGDDRGDINIANEKRKILTTLSKKYDKIIFFDDDPKNIELAGSISGIKTRLIESLNEKFINDSDPINDMGIGIMHAIEDWIKKELGSYGLSLLKNKKYYTIFRRCVMHEKFTFATYILNNYNIDVIDDKDQASPHYSLIRTCAWKGKWKSSKYLIEKGVDLADVIKFVESGNREPETLSGLYTLRDMLKNNEIEDINEKFIQDSDPIHDMGIGFPQYIEHKLNLKKGEKLPSCFVGKKFYGYGRYGTPIHNNTCPGAFDNQYIFMSYRNIEQIDGVWYIQTYWNEFDKDEKYLSYPVDQFLGKDVNEKFTPDSDPIKDLGIGLSNKRNFKNIEDAAQWAYLFPSVCTEDKIHDWNHFFKSRPEMPGLYTDYNNFSPLEIIKWFKYNIKFEPYTSYDIGLRDAKFIYDRLKKIVEEKNMENMNEKFISSSDPIHDLGIGMKRKYDDEVEDFIINLSEKLPSAMEIYLPIKNRIDLYNKIKYQKYKIKTISWDDMDDQWSLRHSGQPSKEWYNIHVKKSIDNGWIKFWYEDNYDSGEFILIKASDNKLKKKMNEDAMGGVSAPMSTLNNTPGMGNAVPATATSIGSGDKWGNTIGGKPYTQAKSIKTNKKKKKTMKRKVRKLEEENLNPYDKIGTAIAKKAKVPMTFKKKKEKGNQNAMVQKKYEHQIITYDEFVKQLNENK